MPTTSKRPSEVSHKFKPTDMPVIRLIRSNLLKSLKYRAKADRVDIITKAIIPDINWHKLGLGEAVINETDIGEDMDEQLETMNTSITNFRKELGEKLARALGETSNNFDTLGFQEASTPEIYDAASAMAEKYHNRAKKHTPRPRPNHPSTSKNQRRPKPAPKAPAHHIDQSPQPTSRPTSPTRISPSTHPTSPNPSTSTTQIQRLPKPTTMLHKSTVPHPSTPTSQSQRLPKASSNLHKSTPTPAMAQPTITSKFPAIKRRSTTKAAPPLPNSRFSHQIPFNFGWN